MENMTMTNFWADRIAPIPAELPPQPSLGQQYSSWQSAKSANGSSGSYIYSSEYKAAITGQRAAQRPSIYVPAQQPTLEERANAPRPSKWDQKLGQSDQDYVSKLKPMLQHLAETLQPDELERVAASYNSAVERLEGGVGTHDQLRAHLTAKADGSGRGIMGSSTPHERAAIVGRFGGRVIDGQGHVTTEALAAMTPLSSVEAYSLARQRQAEAAGQIPQRTEAPTGSSGEGWHVR
jgi:hypothetical protein